MFTQATPPCVVEKWFEANHQMFTPLLGADFYFCPKWSVFPDFLDPHLLLEGGFWHPFCTFFAPFVRPLCTPQSALEPRFCTLSAHPLCAPTPFLHPWCGGLSAPRIFARRAPNASTGFKFGFSSVHACLFLRSLVDSPTASLWRAARCRKPTSRVFMINTWVRPRRETRGRRRHPPRMLFLTARLKCLCLCFAYTLLNT